VSLKQPEKQSKVRSKILF